MLSNLTGWHALIIVGVLAVLALVAAAVIVLVIGSARRRGAAGPAERLAQLDQLRHKGLLSDTEYAMKRQEIIELL